ncbi:MAG: FG-GAP repeat protein, partial [Pseudomonadales bacterium]|nr:FG-GAP repeat protein [Pseudomonadales bacterium]
GELDSGKRTLQSIAVTILFNAQNNDAEIIANKIAAAELFTTYYPHSNFEYSGTDAANAAMDWMSTVGSDESQIEDLVSDFLDVEFGAQVIELATLQPEQGFIILGDETGDRAGSSVSFAGDINGDGLVDILVGARGGDDGGSGAGEAYLIFGSTTGFGALDAVGRAVLDLTLLESETGFVIRGEPGTSLGSVVSSVGDVNGDGITDFALTAPRSAGSSFGPGQAYVIFGKTPDASGAHGFGIIDDDNRSVLDLGTLSANDGLVIVGSGAYSGQGFDVSEAGDVNGDGFNDLIVGTRQYEGGHAFVTLVGKAYVVFGGQSGFGSLDAVGRQVLYVDQLNGVNGFVISGGEEFRLSSASVGGGGDINGDGIADIFVDYPRGSLGGLYAGQTYVIYGSTEVKQNIDLDTLSAEQGFIIQGDTAGDRLGRAALAGDINVDGFDDLVLSALTGGGINAGEAYVVYGKVDGFGELDEFGRSIVDLTYLTADQGFVVRGEAALDLFIAVSSAGDVNGDGFDDLIVGALRNDTGATDAGRSYVLFGSPDGQGEIDDVGRSVLDIGQLDLDEGFVIQSSVENAWAGVVGGGGDVDGDGFDDLIVGAYLGNEAYVVYGGISGFGDASKDLIGSIEGDTLIGGAGDDSLDGKGGPDVLRSGAGDDRLIVADMDFIRVEGGSGFDTLIFDGANLSLDLTTLSATRLNSIERIDLSGSGANRLTLSEQSVYKLTEVRIDDPAVPKAVLQIIGDGDDTIQLVESSWILVGEINDDGVLFNRYAPIEGLGEDEALQVAAEVWLSPDLSIQRLEDYYSTIQELYVTYYGRPADEQGRHELSKALGQADGNVDAIISLFASSPEFIALFGDLSNIDLITALYQQLFNRDPQQTELDEWQGELDSSSDTRETIAFSIFNGAQNTDATIVDNKLAAAELFTSLYQNAGYVYDGNSAVEAARGLLSNIESEADVINFLVEDFLGFSTIIDLTTLTTNQGFIIQGNTQWGDFGYSVADAGDVNGDGFADVIIGAPEGQEVSDSHGEVYLVFGGPEGVGVLDGQGRQVLDVSLLDATQGFFIHNPTAVKFGYSVSGAGDVNDDGFADLLIGAAYTVNGGNSSGEAYVIFGGEGSFGETDDAGRAILDITTLGSESGFIIAADAPGDHLGTRVSGAGDVNGDGIADLIIGAPYGDDGGNIAGEAYVLFGQKGLSGSPDASGRQIVELSNLSSHEGFVIQGADEHDRAGNDVSRAGDVNGDGLIDLIVGAFLASEGGEDSGDVYVLFGRGESIGSIDDTGRRVLDLAGFSGTDGFIIRGADEGDGLGFSVSDVGDINGDGFDDIVVSAAFSDAVAYRAGEAYVIFGRAGGFGNPDEADRQIIDLTTLDSDQGFILQGVAAVDVAGERVAGAGDFNGDGLADFMIAAPFSDRSGNSAGEVYLLFGSTGTFGITDDSGRQVLDLGNISISEGLIIQGDLPGDHTGQGISVAGDVNNDGYSDLIIGAPLGDDGNQDAGEAYIIYGGAFFADTTPVITTGTSAAEVILGGPGNDILNGNGGADVIRSGAGDDLITVADADFFSIDAGTGFDVMALQGGNIALDLTAISNTAVRGVEVIDLTGSGANRLILSKLDVYSLATANVGGMAILSVKGGDDDTVEFTDVGWSYVGTVDEGGLSYDRYQLGTAEVKVAQAVYIDNSPLIFDLATLEVEQGFVIQRDESDIFGTSVSGVGDVNGDGFADVIVGAFTGDDGGHYAGEAYIVFGGKESLAGTDGAGRRVIDLAGLSTNQGFIIQGDEENDRLGLSVSNAGDVNGDGFMDLIVGAHFGDDGGGGAGEAYVLFGGSGGFGSPDGNGRQVIDTTTLNANQGFIIQGDVVNDQAGFSVSEAGDVNGDGFGDVIVGAFFASDGGYTAGEAYVVFGSADPFGVADGVGRQVLDLTGLSAGEGFIIQGDAEGDWTGRSVSSAGDINGDGFADLIIGAQRGDDGGADAGEAYVVFGSADPFGVADGAGRQVLDLTALSVDEGFVIQGDAEGDWAGRSVSSAGDINGDGFSDLIVGASYGEDGGSFAGEAYVILGGASGFGALDGTGRQILDLSSLGVDEGFVIQGDVIGDTLGYSVSGAGDVNGDGYDDLIVSAPGGDKGGPAAGQAYVVYGQSTGIGNPDETGRRILDLTDLTRSDGFIVQGEQAIGQFGWSVSGGGDVNNDGFADLIASARFGNDGYPTSGEAYVVYGGVLGQDTARVVKVGTGEADILIGGPGNDDLNGMGGADVLRAGAGDDLLTVGNADFFRIDGGTGFDTLILSGSGHHLDLSSRGISEVQSIEAIDIRGSGGNQLMLNQLDVLALSEQTNRLLVYNDSDDVVDLMGNFVVTGTDVFSGTTFDVFDSAGSDASVWIQFGKKAAGQDIDLATFSFDQGFIIQGDTAGDQIGSSVASAGDINGDGFVDLIVGGPEGDDGGFRAGEAYVIFGGAGGFGALDGTNRQILDLSTLNVNEGFIIQGDSFSDLSASSVSSAGDINGDGFADLIIGAPEGSDGSWLAGEAYVIFGGSGSFGVLDGASRQVLDLSILNVGEGFVIQGDTIFDHAGFAVSSAGDINGDGYSDVIVGAPEGADGGYRAGEGYVIFGSAGDFGVLDGTNRQVIDLSTLNANQGFIIQGDTGSDRAGQSVASAGDINGDGFADLLVGAPIGAGGGETYVIFGGTGSFGALDGTSRQVLDPSSLTANQGFIIRDDVSVDRAGQSVSSAGDINGDGFVDLIVGAYLGDDGGNNAGEAYVIFGGAGGFGVLDGDNRQVLDLSALNANQGFVIQGDSPYDHAGRSVSGAGDINGDAYDDLIIGAPEGDDGGAGAGEAYVIFGRADDFGVLNGANRQVLDLSTMTASEGFTIQGDEVGDNAGFSVASAGDINGDGYADLIVGAPEGDDGGADAGEAYVIYGGVFGQDMFPAVKVGTDAADILIGGPGNDDLNGIGGADVIRSGAGDDLLTVGNADFFRIDGGTGFDTLALSGNGHHLDLPAAVSARYKI